MSKLSARKIIRTINKGIALNPTSITFTQTVKTEVDGAFEETSTARTINVLIYLEDTNNQLDIESTTQGTSYETKRYKMIADKDANLEINPLNAIEFDCIEGHMEIKGVYSVKVEDTLCGYFVDLKRVN